MGGKEEVKQLEDCSVSKLFTASSQPTIFRQTVAGRPDIFWKQKSGTLCSMAYVERGVVKSKRSLWRLKTFTDFIRSIINFVVVFFTTMFSMEKSDAYKKSSGSSKKWDGGNPGGGSGPYGGGPPGPPRGGLDNVRGLRDVRGGDHSSLPACGSCCG